MSAPAFECDLTPSSVLGPNWPRVRYNFANGWSASVVYRTNERGFNAMIAALAHCPTGQWNTDVTEIGETEASPEEVAQFLATIAAFPAYVP